jgi:metallo-beta-lactamase family protein
MTEHSLSLTFLGAAGTVTGSKSLLEFRQQKILIDCGLFQGLKVMRLMNWDPLPVNPASINAVILTHAHLDHVGYIPLLVKQGFKGKIYATPPTCDLARIILKDSAKLQEEEAELANRGKYTRHKPARPLYTMEDAEKSLSHFVPVGIDKWTDLDSDFRFKFSNSGHILGSAFIEVTFKDKTILFSGDLGRTNPLLLEPPKKMESCDYLVLESTYGDRNHDKRPSDALLSEIVNDALRKKGTLIIPTFALERAQEIMYILNSLRQNNMIPSGIPIYLDSPMGIDATEIMLNYRKWHTLSPDACNRIFNDVIKVRDFKDTLKIIEANQPKIVIAGSGMLSGGRVLEYLKTYIEHESTTVLLVGFQAEGTRGRALLSGADKIKIHGKYYGVRAEVKEISSFSGHADQEEILNWLTNFKKRPKKIFLNHGELAASDALRKVIEEKTGMECSVPLMNSKFLLD